MYMSTLATRRVVDAAESWRVLGFSASEANEKRCVDRGGEKKVAVLDE